MSSRSRRQSLLGVAPVLSTPNCGGAEGGRQRGAATCLTLLSPRSPASASARALARYIGDVSLTSYDCLAFRPSALAAAALTLAATYFARPLPGPEMVVGYSLQELMPAMRCLAAAVRWSKQDLPRYNVPPEHRGVFFKYWEPSKALRQSVHRQHVHREVAELVDERFPEPPQPSGALSAQQQQQGRAAWERAMAAHHALCRCWEVLPPPETWAGPWGGAGPGLGPWGGVSAAGGGAGAGGAAAAAGGSEPAAAGPAQG